MSNLNLQKLREWVWPWPWTFKQVGECSCTLMPLYTHFVPKKT